MTERITSARHGGPRIVAIGGGTGLSTMLRGLKLYTADLTAIVTVADDGGGSGVLREELGMPPPGDIRHCMEALANAEPVMEQLLNYRFPSGSGRLTGQSFGNLILAALNGIYPSFDEAVARMSEVLAISGRVLPVTNENVQLEATFENGSSVVGESKIFQFKKEQDCRIRSVRLLPERPAALPAALEAIGRAELIILGPGSLYTSVIPNLLVDGIAEAVCSAQALKLYVCNIMTQDGETEGMTASEHVAALLKHLARVWWTCACATPRRCGRDFWRAIGKRMPSPSRWTGRPSKLWGWSWSLARCPLRPPTTPAILWPGWQRPSWTSTRSGPIPRSFNKRRGVRVLCIRDQGRALPGGAVPPLLCPG